MVHVKSQISKSIGSINSIKSIIPRKILRLLYSETGNVGPKNIRTRKYPDQENSGFLYWCRTFPVFIFHDAGLFLYCYSWCRTFHVFFSYLPKLFCKFMKRCRTLIGIDKLTYFRAVYTNKTYC